MAVRPRPLTAAVLAASLAATGCGATAALHAAAPRRAGAAPHVAAAAATAPRAAAARPAAAPGPATGAVALRNRLEQLLGEHTVLVVRLMRGRLAERPDFLQATTQALGRNTDDLAATVASAYGAGEAAAFHQQWTGHVLDLASYSSALASGDRARQQSARTALAAYSTAYGGFVARVTRGGISAAAAAASVRMHVADLTAQADAYARHDYTGAYRWERTAYAHMFTTGRTLAGAISRQRAAELPAAFDAPPQRLRSALGQLLGEHMQLAVDAMRAAAVGSPEFPAAAAALGGNTADLARAFEALFGAQAAVRFGELWGSHVDAVVAYSVAVGRHDAAGRARATGQLRTFATGMAGFLSTAVAGTVTPAAAAAALGMHDQDLMRQVEAYAARDFPRSYDVALAAYRHMFAIADVLAGGIEARLAGRLPRGGVQTGGGGTAPGRAGG